MARSGVHFPSRISSIKEPQGLLRADGKRPDGLTLTTWKEGRCATWDVTVTDTVAASYLSATSACAGSAADAAAKRKEDITPKFFPINSFGNRPAQFLDQPRRT